jgi:hypothetical protein
VASRVVLAVEALLLLAPISVVAGFVLHVEGWYRYTGLIAPNPDRQVEALIAAAFVPVLVAAWWVVLRFVSGGRAWLAQAARWPFVLLNAGVLAIAMGTAAWMLHSLGGMSLPFVVRSLPLLMIFTPLLVPHLHVAMERRQCQRSASDHAMPPR